MKWRLRAFVKDSLQASVYFGGFSHLMNCDSKENPDPFSDTDSQVTALEFVQAKNFLADAKALAAR